MQDSILDWVESCHNLGLVSVALKTREQKKIDEFYAKHQSILAEAFVKIREMYKGSVIERQLLVDYCDGIPKHLEYEAIDDIDDIINPIDEYEKLADNLLRLRAFRFALDLHRNPIKESL